MKSLLFISILPFFIFGQTPCLDAVANASDLIGEFIPQCEEDGSYSPLQCWASTGYCWCVDENGNEIAGTSLGPGQGIPDCESTQLNLCDSIYVYPVNYDEINNIFQISIDMNFSDEFWFGYCGLMITNSLGDTIAQENFNTSSNVYGLGSGMSELRYLEIEQASLMFPINGQVHLVEGFFAGNSNIACSWPFYFNYKNNSQLVEDEGEHKLISTYDFLGRNKTLNKSSIIKYKNGSFEKIIMIK